MNILSRLKILIVAALIVAGFSQAEGRRHYRHAHRHAPRVVVVPAAKQPKVVSHKVTNRFSQKERLAMALAYLRNNSRLTVKQYMKITSLKKEAAEAELDAFSMDRNIPIGAVIEGKKKFYVMLGPGA